MPKCMSVILNKEAIDSLDEKLTSKIRIQL